MSFESNGSPTANPGPTMSRIHVVGAAITRNGRCLVTQRGPQMTLAGRWEFPGGKVDAHETPEAALTREVHEELGLHVEIGQLLGRGVAIVDTRTIRLDVYAAFPTGGEITLREHAQFRWLAAAELPDLEWAAADIPVIPSVQRWLESLGLP